MKKILLCALLLVPVATFAQRGRPGPPPAVRIPAIRDSATPASVRALLSVIADDSMEGRAVWSKGSDRAAKFIAEQMKRIGLAPAGDSGYFQRIAGAAPPGGGRIQRLASFADWDSIPADRRRLAVNVVGVLAGHSTAADSIVLVDAHYDHLGVRGPGVNGDSIYNGADDDASGTVAVLEIARIMKQWPTPGRTVVFLATTGEESGLVGTGWYLAHPVRPLTSMAANLEIEMIGRPDTIATGHGRGWLTGFERSTMGENFQRAGLPIMADMRPTEGFFRRSDNIAFAQSGIPAHTLSSFNGHSDYHRVTDDITKVDFPHMAAVINTGARAIWVLTEGAAPVWQVGGRPCPATEGERAARVALARLSGAAADSARLVNQFPQSCK